MPAASRCGGPPPPAEPRIALDAPPNGNGHVAASADTRREAAPRAGTGPSSGCG